MLWSSLPGAAPIKNAKTTPCTVQIIEEFRPGMAASLAREGRLTRRAKQAQDCTIPACEFAVAQTPLTVRKASPFRAQGRHRQGADQSRKPLRAVEKQPRRLQLRDMGAARDDLESARGRPAASSCDIGGGVASSCSPTSTRTGTFTLCKFGAQIERRQRIAGGAKHVRVGAQESFAAILHQVRMLRPEIPARTAGASRRQ